ncbi:hypothetical protein RCC89_20160 [Cytophagaceae bacterium ABcell3]|nr:hypothetical protein RCC89_20160 [Cytophagaceae bacterium ABcell3]
MKKLVLCLCFLSQIASGQSIFVPYDKDYYHLTERYEIRSGRFSHSYHHTFQPYTSKAIAEFSDSLERDTLPLSKSDKFNLDYLQNDNWEWSELASPESERPILRRLYRTKPDFFHYQSDNFFLRASPVFHFSGGRETASDVTTYINTRGVELRGMIDEKVGFYSLITENQMAGPLYVRRYIAEQDAVPGEGYYKLFKDHGVDFMQARGYITFNATKNIALQFGHDRNFIGHGYRSLVLSDFSPNYTFLKVNTRLWRFNYTNLFAELNGGRFFPWDHVYPKKYMALHHLSFNVSDNFNIGIFESVIIGRNDTLGSARQFDLNYLNPVIFYRAIEQHVGSPDNVKVGLDYRWNFLQRFSLYGQLVLDEFHLQHLRERNGWWGNKFAYQQGFKYIDVAGISNLDFQFEVNVVRPYMYTHYDSFTNYTHYNQPIAHPLGANFHELLGIIRYQPIPRLNLMAKGFYVRYGADTAGTNWGGNIHLDYSTFEQEFGNTIGQGVATSLKYISLNASYQLRHNLFIDVGYLYRRTDSEEEEFESSTHFASLGVRLNIARRVHPF